MPNFRKTALISFTNYLFAWAFLLSPNLIFAQKELSLCEVTVKGIKPERFMVGQKVQEIDSANLARNRFSTMADFLQFQSPIAFKSYGAGQATSISFRGTSANHTALLWNGVNINFPSLGLTDFSTIPLAGFDQMTIQYGSAASCVGTDAVGGSIQLRSMPHFNQTGFHGFVGLKAESSENYSSQIGLRFNKNLNESWKFSAKTLIYGSLFNHNFGTEPIKNSKGEQYNVEPIRTNQMGFTQDFFFLHKNGNLLTFNLWIANNDLMIQPKKPDISQKTLTEASRFLMSYQFGKTLFRLGFIRDITDFSQGNEPNPSHTEIDRYIVRIEHDFSWIKDCNKGTNLKIGAELVHFDANVDAYKTKKAENRLDFYALFRHQFSAKLSSSINLRQAFVTNYNPPFTPSLGIDYQIFRNQNTKISVPANIALSYRVPTLNERYWAVLGNPEIRPEKGFNKEIGLVFQQKLDENSQAKFGISAFHNLIDNWTYWNPDKNYRVENLQQVLAKGLEVELNFQTKFSENTISANFQYALTNSSQQKEFGFFSKEILNKQLIYVPRHATSSTISATRKSFSLSVQQMFNSERHITFDHSGRPFPPYYLMNLNMNYQLKKHFDFAFQINNLTNTLYPNLKKNAMPMRSFSANLLFNF